MMTTIQILKHKNRGILKDKSSPLTRSISLSNIVILIFIKNFYTVHYKINYYYKFLFLFYNESQIDAR